MTEIQYMNQSRPKDTIKRKPLTRQERKSSFDELLKELSSISEECLSETSKDLNTFKNAQKNFVKLKEQTLKLKEFPSDLHVFLGTRQVYKDVDQEIKSIKLTASLSKSYHIEINHPIIEDLHTQIYQFGKVKLEKRESGLLFYDASMGQAYIKEKCIQNVVLRINQKINLKKKNGKIFVYGCAILPSGQLWIANTHTKTPYIQEYNENGIHTRNITTAFPSFDIALFGSNCVAV